MSEFRPVYCLLGLPFDLLDLEQASQRIESYRGADGAILSTPNVNWVMLARRHPWLRESVLRSSLSVVDGMPLVWIGRLTGIPFPERVSGSDLFNRLKTSRRTFKVFFFGGQSNVAERASSALGAGRTALQGCGGINPGSGDLQSMSTPSMIEPIRAADPDMVVVSLGALRGQAWIIENHRALGAPWVTHLGAVVNFVAGEIGRAPGWVGKFGLEWMWRIIEEPKLWKRYWADGLELLSLIGRNVLPLLFWQRLYSSDARQPTWRLQRANGPCAIELAGAWRDCDATALYQGLRALLSGAQPEGAAETPSTKVEIDMSGVTYLSPGVVGQLLIWHGRLLESGSGLEFVRLSQAADRLLRAYAVDYLIRAR